MPYKPGDTVWFYEPDFIQCTQGVIVAVGSDQLIEIQPTIYTDDGKKHKEFIVIRAVGEVWSTMDGCIEWVAHDFEEELRRNTVSWYDEQQDYKKLHDTKEKLNGESEI